eukprot:8600048-Heterocapsa_arctica.AAC.1
MSGSHFDFEFMLEHCTDHVMLIQKHWRLKEELHTWQTLAHLTGWQGIWESANVTEHIRMESLVDQEELQFSFGMADRFLTTPLNPITEQ